LFWSAGQPFDGEEEQDGKLSGHEELPEMSGRSLVGLANDATCTLKEAVDRSASQYPQGAERHCDWKKGTGVFEDYTKRIGIPIHVASLGWNDVFAEGRPEDICRFARAPAAGLKKLLELPAVAVSPGTGIETHE
jgi:hypothetical protein